MLYCAEYMGFSTQLRRILTLFGLVLALSIPIYLARNAAAQTDEGAFSLQVSPSPIITVIKPEVKTSVELQIRNTGLKKEDLRVDLKKFNVNNSTGEIALTDDLPDEVSSWIAFQSPVFSIDPGAVFNQAIQINPPAAVGFSYSFAIVITRVSEPVNNTGKTKLKGSVAVFTLLTVDRPGVIRKYDISEFSSPRRSYEYLPVKFTIKLKNSGNTIVQPTGNIFIQRSPTAVQPISVLTLNPSGAYLLPAVSRELSVDWRAGFPVYETVKTAENAAQKQHLLWRWANLQNFRFGRYYAKLVAVYNDGQRDIPIEAVISFWVIPWKLLLSLVFLLVIFSVGVLTIIRKTTRSLKKKRHGQTKPKA